MFKKLIVLSLIAFGSYTLIASTIGSKVEKSALRSSKFDSFNEVLRQLAMNPWSPEDHWGEIQKLPQYIGVETGDLIELLVNAFLQREGDMSEDWPFAKRSRELFTNSANFNPESKVKWLHPRGVCASAKWIIPDDSPSKATGLFAPGTEVSAVLRLSTGTHASERLYNKEPQGRIFGMAVKLFHQQDDSKKAITSNIVTLDHKGFSRSDRPFMLIEGKKDLFFTNFAPVESIIGSEKMGQTVAGQLLSKALDMFDDPNFARPVYVTANYDQNGNKVSKPTVPFELRFTPRFITPVKNYDDFRLELLDYDEGSFDINIVRLNESDKPEEVTIGSIKLDFPMFITHNCDLRLSFHHSPVQWKEQYEDSSLDLDQLEE